VTRCRSVRWMNFMLHTFVIRKRYIVFAGSREVIAGKLCCFGAVPGKIPGTVYLIG
jgi:hypothetical protein